MPHEQSDNLSEELSAYLDGELDAQTRAKVDAYLAGDAEARQVLAELRQTRALLQTLPRGQAPKDLLDAITARLERRQLLADEAPASGRFGQFSRRFGRLVASAAVIFLAATVGYVTYRHVGRAPESASGPAIALREETSGRTEREAAAPARPAPARAAPEGGAAAPPPPTPRGARAGTRAPGDAGGGVVERVAKAGPAKPGAPEPDLKKGPHEPTFEEMVLTNASNYALAQHRFDREPLQVTLVAANNDVLDHYARQAEAFFARNNMANVRELPPAGSVKAAQKLYLPAKPGVNTLALGANQYLSRMSPEQLAGLLSELRASAPAGQAQLLTTGLGRVEPAEPREPPETARTRAGGEHEREPFAAKSRAASAPAEPSKAIEHLDGLAKAAKEVPIATWREQSGVPFSYGTQPAPLEDRTAPRSNQAAANRGVDLSTENKTAEEEVEGQTLVDGDEGNDASLMAGPRGRLADVAAGRPAKDAKLNELGGSSTAQLSPATQLSIQERASRRAPGVAAMPKQSLPGPEVRAPAKGIILDESRQEAQAAHRTGAAIASRDARSRPRPDDMRVTKCREHEYWDRTTTRPIRHYLYLARWGLDLVPLLPEEELNRQLAEYAARADALDDNLLTVVLSFDVAPQAAARATQVLAPAQTQPADDRASREAR